MPRLNGKIEVFRIVEIVRTADGPLWRCLLVTREHHTAVYKSHAVASSDRARGLAKTWLERHREYVDTTRPGAG